MEDFTEKQEYWINQFQEAGALWFHDGNHKKPHDLLTSGKPSDGFFHAGKIVFDDPLMTQKICISMNAVITQKLRPMNVGRCSLSKVAGPAFGTLILAANIAAERQNLSGHKIS